MCNMVMHEHDLWQSGFVKLRSSSSAARGMPLVLLAHSVYGLVLLVSCRLTIV